MVDRLGFGTKLLLVWAVLMLAAGLAIERLGSAELQAAMETRVRQELVSKIRLLEDAAIAEGMAGPQGRAAWDRLADRFGERAGARVTLIAEDGAVVGDSEVALAGLGALENHASRDEVVLAREAGEGSAIRPSPTLDRRMIYVARRHPEPGRGVAFIRLAVPLTEVDVAIARSRRLLGLETVAAVALALLAAVYATYRLTRPVRELTEAALAMAGGDLDARASANGADEVARLGRALNRMARELSRTIGELRGDRDLLASILEGMSEGVLVLDEGRIVLANRALRAMTLLGPDAVGKSVIEAIRNAELQAALDRAGDSEEAVVREVDLGGLMPRKLLVRVSRLGGSPGGEGVIAVFHDVTDLRRLETIRTDFVANVSHELRTPVTGISTAAETLQAGALSDPAAAREFVDVIDRQAKRLRQLVDDLLDLSKIEAKSFRLKLTDLDVASVVEQAVRLIEEPARRRKVTMTVAAPPERVRARGDRRALDQVLSNLFDNAVKYAGEGARVEVTVAIEGENVVISVRDNGPGIAAAHLGRIFERFYRVDTGRSRDLGGTGLGLSIVKHMVELQGGTIAAESEPGKGACFTVRLKRVA